MSLLDKLDNVQVKPTQALGDYDQTALVFYQREYLEALNDPNAWEAAVAHLTGGGEWLTRQMEKSKREVRDAREAAARHFIHQTLHFFEREHTLTLDPHPLLSLASKRLDEEGRDLTQPLITPEEIANYVLERLGGKSFHEAAVEELKAEFKNAVVRGPQYSRYLTATQKGRIVRLEGFLYLETYFDGTLHLSYRGEPRWTLLQRVVSHFETPSITGVSREVSEAIPSPRAFGRNPEPVGDYAFAGCKRVSSLTVYKNGNVAIKFPTNELAIEFCRQYDLLTA